VLAALVVVALAVAYDVAPFAFVTYVPITLHGWSAAQASLMFIVAGVSASPAGRSAACSPSLRRRPIGVLFLVGLTFAELSSSSAGRTRSGGFTAMVFFQGGKMTIVRTGAAELFTSFSRRRRRMAHGRGRYRRMGGLALAGALAPHVGSIHAALAVSRGPASSLRRRAVLASRDPGLGSGQRSKSPPEPYRRSPKLEHGSERAVGGRDRIVTRAFVAHERVLGVVEADVEAEAGAKSAGGSWRARRAECGSRVPHTMSSGPAICGAPAGSTQCREPRRPCRMEPVA
jgi:hypothetical protein